MSMAGCCWCGSDAAQASLGAQDLVKIGLERFHPDLEKSVRSKPLTVIPAKAGIQQQQAPSLGKRHRFGYQSLDSRLRGNDKELSVRVKPH